MGQNDPFNRSSVKGIVYLVNSGKLQKEMFFFFFIVKLRINILLFIVVRLECVRWPKNGVRVVLFGGSSRQYPRFFFHKSFSGHQINNFQTKNPIYWLVSVLKRTVVNRTSP